MGYKFLPVVHLSFQYPALQKQLPSSLHVSLIELLRSQLQAELQ